MRPLAIVGMCLVVAGIVIAVLGRRDPSVKARMSRDDRRGYFFALFSAIGQSVGMILTKRDIGDYDALSATQIRVLVGVVGFAVASVLA
ncbi:MAG TPA: hypothetical protein PLI66_08155, partial [Spirochaetales bacterium]|nr:hypothetical protein [Spirochaetales bacterium]